MKIVFILTILIGLTQAYGVSLNEFSSSSHEVQSIESGTAALAQRLNMIERAKKKIDVEYFIYDTSLAARIFTEALIRKKMNHPEVKIRIIVDYFQLSKSLSSFEIWALKEHDIEVKQYNPTSILNLKNVTNRNHRKILAIDDSEAIVGGRNMASEYFDLKPGFNFSDRDIWVKGDIVKNISQSFEKFWNFKKTITPRRPKEPVRRHGQERHYYAQKRNFERKSLHAKVFSSLLNPQDEKDQEIIQLRENIIEKGNAILMQEPIYRVDEIRFIADGPDWKLEDHGLTGKEFYTLMGEAKKEISIEVPYFYLQQTEEDFFKELQEEGIAVNLLINSKKASNEFAINYIVLREGVKLSKMGFQVYLNQGKLFNYQDLPSKDLSEKTIWGVHAKTLIVDDEMTWIGTLNMDPRSIQRLNSELAIVIKNHAFTERVKQHFSYRINEAKQMLNGKVSGENLSEKDPSELDGFLEYMARIKTFPMYLFENQI